MRVTVQDKWFVGFGESIPMEPGYDNSVDQYIAKVTNNNEETTKNCRRYLYWKKDNCPKAEEISGETE